MCSNFKGVGAWHTLTDEERAEYGWYPADVINEGYDALTQTRSALPDLTFDGERIKAEYTITEKPLETIRQESLESLADIRYAREIEGVTSSDGIQQWTDRANRALLTDKISFMSNNPGIKQTSWKSRNGFVQLDVEGLKDLQSLVGFHVDQTYKAENEVSDMIVAAETIEDLLSINIADEFEIAFSGS
jgi:hypothetical protein